MFHLNISNRAVFASAVLMQETTTGQQPLAYCSTKLDSVEQGLLPCYQRFSLSCICIPESLNITMGHAVILYTSYQLHALITSTRFLLNHVRMMYEV